MTQGKTIPKLTIEQNWVIVKFSYSDEIVLPIKEATELMTLLGSAYKYDENYGKQPTIRPIGKSVTFQLISNEDYKQARNNHMLGVNDE
jgi:hypothetical protein